MRYLRAAALVFLLLCSCARPAAAAFATGEELAARCMSEAKADRAYCVGYIAGVLDYHLLIQSLGTSPSVDFCMPENLSVQDAAVAVLRYMKRNPMSHPFIASPAVAMAMSEAFPCKPPPQKKRGRKRK